MVFLAAFLIISSTIPVSIIGWTLCGIPVSKTPLLAFFDFGCFSFNLSVLHYCAEISHLAALTLRFFKEFLSFFDNSAMPLFFDLHSKNVLYSLTLYEHSLYEHPLISF